MFWRNFLLYVQKRRRDIFKMGRECFSVHLASFYHVTQCYVTEEGIAQDVRDKIRTPYVENVTQGAQIASSRPSISFWNDQRENGGKRGGGNRKSLLHSCLSGSCPLFPEQPLRMSEVHAFSCRQDAVGWMTLPVTKIGIFQYNIVQG